MKSRGKSKRPVATGRDVRRKPVTQPTAKKETTSWGSVADWYAEHLTQAGTYHERVLGPNVIRLLAPHRGRTILEIGCGEGYFSRLLHSDGHSMVGSDISSELIQKARSHDERISYHVSPAERLSFAADGIFTAALAVLTLQNMEHVEPVFREASRVLAPRGRFVGVINHPAFRIPGSSSWGFDNESQTQFRRIDSYLSARKNKIDMTPGKRTDKEFTYSFHRSFQEYSKALRAGGFAIIRVEEWISHRESQPGPRAEAENTARKEFPLFLAFEAVKIAPAGHLT